MTASSPSILIYHPIIKVKKGEPKIKGQKAYFTFRGGNQSIALDKVDAVVCQRFLGQDNAEQMIAAVLKRPVTDHWIAEEAAELGLTLVEVITAAVNYNEQRPRSIKVAEGPEHLASILAKLAPNEDGVQLLNRLKDLIDACGPEAVEIVNECAARVETKDTLGGRDGQGFVYLRKQKKAA